MLPCPVQEPAVNGQVGRGSEPMAESDGVHSVFASVADDVVVQAVHAAEVPPAGGEGFSLHEHVAMIQPVVVAFAQYLRERAEVGTTEPGSQDSARGFWAALSPYGDAVDTVRVVAALEALTEQAPHHLYPVTD